MRIGIIGTGRMGAAIAERLLGFGHELSVWNRSSGKTLPLQAKGAKVAASPAELAGHCDLIFSILTDANAIDQAYRGEGGEHGVLSADIAGKLFVEMSTVRPDTQTALHESIVARGGSMIDCPVGGTVGPAREGKLLALVGGSDADVLRARPVLEQLCRRIEHVGPIGAGARLKLAINLPLLVFWQSFGEALSLAAPLHLDSARLIDIFADTSGGPNMLKGRGPALAAVLAGAQPGAATFNIDSIRKDMRTMQEEAQALGRELPVTSAALKVFDRAAREGMGEADGINLPAWWLKTE